MTLPDAASLVILGSLQSKTLTSEEVAFFEQEQPLGITLFGRNIVQEDDFAATKSLLQDLQKLKRNSTSPFLVAIDQEGGRVARLKASFPNQGPALHLAQSKSDAQSLEDIEAYGADVGRSLKAIGVHINFAPVLDILTERGHDSIGDRVFGKDPEAVIKRAGAFLRGLESASILGCLKHFPGQGDGHFDTHLSQTKIDSEKDILWNRELVPFRALIPQAKMVMASHCIYTAICPQEASRSKAWLTDILRDELGFNGVAVSDDMTMGAVYGDKAAWIELLCDSIMAGCDMILVCQELGLWRQALEGLRGKARTSSAFRQRLDEAARRVQASLLS